MKNAVKQFLIIRWRLKLKTVQVFVTITRLSVPCKDGLIYLEEKENYASSFDLFVFVTLQM